MKHIIYVPGSHCLIHHCSQPGNSHIQKIRKSLSDHTKGQPENQSHNTCKAWNSCIFTCKYFIHLLTTQMLLALMRLNHGLRTDFFNKIKAHMGNRCGPVKPTLRLHLLYNMLQGFFFILIQSKFFQDQFIPFCKFTSSKTYRDICLLSMILNEMHNSMKTSVNGSAVIVCITEIQPLWFFLIFCHMNGMCNQFINTFIFCCGNRYNRNPQGLLHLVHTHRTTILPYFIHHIQCQYHRHIQLHQLHSKIKISLDIRGIHNIDNSLRMLLQNKASGYDFLAGIGGHGINSRQVCHQSILFPTDNTILAVYSNSRKVAYMLTGAG